MVAMVVMMAPPMVVFFCCMVGPAEGAEGRAWGTKRANGVVLVIGVVAAACRPGDHRGCGFHDTASSATTRLQSSTQRGERERTCTRREARHEQGKTREKRRDVAVAR